MERPQVDIQPKQRKITGEIMYLDSMRKQGEVPEPYLDLADMAIQSYENGADLCAAHGVRPDIMDEYEKYDRMPSQVVASCEALADKLLELKEPGDRFTFINITVETSPESTLEKLKSITAGSILTSEEEQLAIPSNGEYYPVLDIRKQNAKLFGVGLRVWGWEDPKVAFTHQEGEQRQYPQDVLFYPSDEKNSSRQLELIFGYRDKTAGIFTESVSLYISPSGHARIVRDISANAYFETSYEGHKQEFIENPTDEDIAAFGDLVAEIVGDNPKKQQYGK